MNLLTRLAIILGKLVSFISTTFGLGAGATWPGEIALRINPRILQTFAAKAQHIILVAGTNGKTTTVKMIETILVCAKKHVRRNASGANLDNGLVSAFIEDARLSGALRSSYFIFEVDEATLPNVLKAITPEMIVLTNIFRDQLDRYGEVDTIAEKWLAALENFSISASDSGNQGIKRHQTTVIINADDPHLAFIGSKLGVTVRYFGLDDSAYFRKHMQHATDTIYCPNCGSRLTFGGVYFSHLGKWACGKCGFMHPEVDIAAKDVQSPVEGVYNYYNALAAALACRNLGLSDKSIQEGLLQFRPAFGRMESVSAGGKTVKILLSKNPTGFNESLRTVLESSQHGPLLLLLNDRIPDGRDVSWVWDVDFEDLKGYKHPIVVSGDRCYDLGLRLKYAEVKTGKIYEQLDAAIHHGLALTKSNGTLWILPTYSAMLEARKTLTGRKIL